MKMIVVAIVWAAGMIGLAFLSRAGKVDRDVVEALLLVGPLLAFLSLPRLMRCRPGATS